RAADVARARAGRPRSSLARSDRASSSKKLPQTERAARAPLIHPTSIPEWVQEVRNWAWRWRSGPWFERPNPPIVSSDRHVRRSVLIEEGIMNVLTRIVMFVPLCAL